MNKARGNGEGRMPSVKGVVERRSHKRHKVLDVSAVVGARRVGHILDMSLGGLSFSYIEYKELPSEKLELGIVFGKNGRYLEKLPARIVSDHVFSHGPEAHPVVIRRCSMQFLSFDEAQLLDLTAFIDDHSKGTDS